jgi:hypothetical protein
MIHIFNAGGPFFMGLLTLILFISVVFAVISFLQKKNGNDLNSKKYIQLTKDTGLLALVIGAFAQLLGLYEAFSAIEQMGTVSQSMLIGGLKVSSITTLYGMLIFILSFLLTLGMKLIPADESED